MIWWVKRHRAGVILLAVVAYGAVLTTIGNHHVPLPRIADAVTDLLPIRLIAPLALVVVLLWAKGDFTIEREAVRPVPLYWHLLLVLVAALSAIVCVLAQQLDLFGDAWATERNLLGFLGLGLVLSHFFSAEISAAALTAVVFAGMILPRTPDGTLLPGAWPILDSGNGPSWLIAAGLMGAGACSAIIALSHRRLRPRGIRHSPSEASRGLPPHR